MALKRFIIGLMLAFVLCWVPGWVSAVSDPVPVPANSAAITGIRDDRQFADLYRRRSDSTPIPTWASIPSLGGKSANDANVPIYIPKFDQSTLKDLGLIDTMLEAIDGEIRAVSKMVPHRRNSNSLAGRRSSQFLKTMARRLHGAAVLWNATDVFLNGATPDIEMAGVPLLQIGGAAIGGAIVTSGLFTAAYLFGTAGTGVAISSLSGAAATNATLAWLGGGTIAAGGGGMVAGTALVATGVGIAVIGATLAAKPVWNYFDRRERNSINHFVEQALAKSELLDFEGGLGHQLFRERAEIQRLLEQKQRELATLQPPAK